MAIAEVKTLYETNLRDIPAMLRRMADRVEKKELDPLGMLCIVELAGEVQIYGWGASAELDHQALVALRAGDWLMRSATKEPRG